MQQIIEKASVLIDALPFIQRFRGETVVVKFGGSIMEDEAGVQRILQDVAFMECVGLRPVIVHGGGKAISKAMKDENLVSNFVQGLRVTDAASVQVVERVFNQIVNPSLVKMLQGFGCKARGMHGDDLITVKKKTGMDRESGAAIDWEYVGEVVDVDATPIQAYLEAGITPVITPLGWGDDQHAYNVNADEAASNIALHLKARKLVFLSDVPGLLANIEDPSTLISHLELGQVEDYVASGVIGGGMIPKIGGAVNALKAGVRKVHLIDSFTPHSLLLELFTEKGVGTEIVS